MDNNTINVERVSALAGHYDTGHFGHTGSSGVTLTEVPNMTLVQLAAWPQTLAEVASKAATAAGANAAPGPGQAIDGSQGSLLRIEPLKWWLFGATADAIDAESGTTIDISHSRTHIRITGDAAATLLNRHLPLDLRDASFAVNSVASTAFHHVGVTLWRSQHGYELFLPRGFAVSLWEGLLESAEQFGVDVV